jgi:type II secretory pathway pseudopilin PulG
MKTTQLRPMLKVTAMTLLEVVLAVAILSMVSLAVFQFVKSNIQAIATTSADINEEVALERLVELLQEEFYNLPTSGQSSLISKAVKLSGRDVDLVEWRSKGGPGLLTTAAKGEYIARLRIKPLKEDSRRYEIGIEREMVVQETALGLVAGAGTSKPDWIPLIANAQSLRCRFFDPRLNTEVENWADPSARPSFMRIAMMREGDSVPMEAVVGIPAAIATQTQ